MNVNKESKNFNDYALSNHSIPENWNNIKGYLDYYECKNDNKKDFIIMFK